MENLELSTAAKAARAAYKGKWRADNKEKIAEYNKNWHAKPQNKDKRKEYAKNFWERKALEADE